MPNAMVADNHLAASHLYTPNPLLGHPSVLQNSVKTLLDTLSRVIYHQILRDLLYI